MKYLVSLIFLISSLYSNDFDIEYKGYIGIDYKQLKYKHPMAKDKKQKTLEAKIELTKYIEDNKLYLKIEAINDFDEDNRRYFKINELYYKIQNENYDLIIGKDIKYWGALELNNLSDVYNKKNIKNDPFDKAKKLGTKAISFTYYAENEDELSLIVSHDEVVSNEISTFIKYSGSRDDVSQRDFTYILNSKDKKFITFHTLIHKDTIYKFEYLYSNKNKTYQTGIGFEHTLYSLIEKKDLGIMLEYYKSNNANIRYKRDIFAGTRLTFNDTSSSDIAAGIIKNNIKNEWSYSLEYNTRINNLFTTKLSYLKNDNLKLYAINLAYHF